MAPLFPRRRLLQLGAGAALAAVGRPAAAQAFPQRPLRIVVPFPAGGSIDFIARVAAREMTPALGQPVVVENRPGATGKIGVLAVKQSAPDGYTLLLATSLTHGINPALVGDQIGYDAMADFAPAALLAENQINFLVRSDLNIGSVAELIALIRANPGKLNFGTGGTGSAQQMMGAVFLAQAGLAPDAAMAVPYQGEAPAFADLLGGRVQFMITSGNKAAVENGTLRVIATTGRRRSLVYPAAPTMTELGYTDVYYAGWYGLEAPAGTPPAVLARLNAAAAVLQTEQLRGLLVENGFEPRGGDPAFFRDLVTQDAAHWQRVVKQYNLA